MTGGEYVLWGIHPGYAQGQALKLAIGTLRDCRAEKRQRERDGGWLLGTYAKGAEPIGLRMRAA